MVPADFSKRFTTDSEGDDQVVVLSYAANVLKVRLPVIFFEEEIPLNELSVAVGGNPLTFISNIARDNSDSSNYILNIAITDETILDSTPTNTFVHVTRKIPENQITQTRNFDSVQFRTLTIGEALDYLTRIAQSLKANKADLDEIGRIVVQHTQGVTLEQVNRLIQMAVTFATESDVNNNQNIGRLMNLGRTLQAIRKYAGPMEVEFISSESDMTDFPNKLKNGGQPGMYYLFNSISGFTQAEFDSLSAAQKAHFPEFPLKGFMYSVNDSNIFYQLYFSLYTGIIYQRFSIDSDRIGGDGVTIKDGINWGANVLSEAQKQAIRAYIGAETGGNLEEVVPADNDKIVIERDAHTDSIGAREASDDITLNRASYGSSVFDRPVDSKIIDGNKTLYLRNRDELTIIKHSDSKALVSDLDLNLGDDPAFVLNRDISGNKKELLFLAKDDAWILSRQFDANYSAGSADLDASNSRRVRLNASEFLFNNTVLGQLHAVSDGTKLYVINTNSNTLMNIYVWDLATGGRKAVDDILNIRFSQGESISNHYTNQAVLYGGKIYFLSRAIPHPKVFVIDIARKTRNTELDFTPDTVVGGDEPFLSVSKNRLYVQWTFQTTPPSKTTWYAYNAEPSGVVEKKFITSFEDLSDAVIGRIPDRGLGFHFQFFRTPRITKQSDLAGTHRIGVYANRTEAELSGYGVNKINFGFQSHTIGTLREGFNEFNVTISDSEATQILNNLSSGDDLSIQLILNDGQVRTSPYTIYTKP